MKVLLCSECFKDQGLRLDAMQIGYPKKSICPNCKSKQGTKLDKTILEHLAYRFFVRGTLWKVKYGIVPVIQFNNSRYGTTEIRVSKRLEKRY